MSFRSMKVAISGLALLVPCAANAGITLSGKAHQTNPTGPGSYRVSVYASKAGAQFAFRVYNVSANWGFLGSGNTHLSQVPPTDADTVRVQFFSGNVNANHTSCSGAVVGGVVVSGSASTFPTKVGGTGGGWTTSGGTRAMFTNGGGTLANRELRELDKDNSNMFAESASGRIMVSLAAKCFTVQLTDFNNEAGETFTTYDALAFQIPNLNGIPEGSSAALMLPGLLAVGFGFWRRRSNRSSDNSA